MVGLVIVSHSPRLAEGIAELAREMGGHDLSIETAAGIADGALGTDAMLVAQAVERAWSQDGVLVLMDLGSAVLSAEMALEMLSEDRRARVLLCEAPIAEGAIAAAVTARLGASLEQVASEARNGLAGKVGHLGIRGQRPSDDAAGAVRDGGVSRSIRLVVSIPHGLHARPAARLVHATSAFDASVKLRNVTSGRGPVDARSLSGVASLAASSGHEIEVSASGPEADAALDAIAQLAAGSFGDVPEPAQLAVAAADAGPAPEPTAGSLRGRTASPGVAIGPARHLIRPELQVPAERAEDPAPELRALDEALRGHRGVTTAQRDALAARGRADEAAIFDAHLLFLEDAAILGPTTEAIRGGASAPSAWHDAVAAAVRDGSTAEDPYLLARAEDLRAVGRQVLASLLRVEVPAPRLDEPGIVVAENLAPTDVVGLGPEVLGVALAEGGPTSHAMIVARALGIPAIVGLGAGILDVGEGTTIAVDALRGVVHVEPEADVVVELEAVREAAQTSIREAQALAAAPATTLDGLRVGVVANISYPDEAVDAVGAGAEGVGLFRSEYLFMGRDTLPDVDEQTEAYRRAAEALGGRPLTVRTLDIGADKPLPALRLPIADNPALGLRGLRLGLARPDLLRTQLLALLRVAGDFHVRIMFPMVSTVEEIRSARRALEDTRRVAAGSAHPPPDRVEFGVMVEVPAAALMARRLAAEVDFLSIGTNDLTQYVFAADRGDPSVEHLADPLHPAVLALIQQIAEAARAHGRGVAVCGELAADPDAVPLLVGLGITELSVGIAALPMVKQVVRRMHAGRASALAAKTLACEGAADVRALVASS